MTLWQMSLCCAILLVKLSNARSEIRTSLLPGKSVISIIPELFGYTGTAPPVTASFEANPGLLRKPEDGDKNALTSDEVQTEPFTTSEDADPEPPDLRYPVQHAGLPQGLAVSPLSLKDSYHELKFNVSWQQSFGPPARDYSLEISSVTDTIDCQSPMCYEYNIPGEATWWVVPAYPNPVAETCAVRPGCAYLVRLIAHPWDGHTAANLHVALDECVAGVCSCAHSPRLPVPEVKAHTISIQGEIFVNVSWITSRPTYPQRLPPGLRRQRYAVSIAKQMVSDAHPSPWFANTAPPRYVDADGAVADTDTVHWLLLPVADRSTKRGDERRDKRITKPRNLVLDVRLLARVSLIDDRGCLGPQGNATAYGAMGSLWWSVRRRHGCASSGERSRSEAHSKHFPPRSCFRSARANMSPPGLVPAAVAYVEFFRGPLRLKSKLIEEIWENSLRNLDLDKKKYIKKTLV